jgi:phosphoribosylanthranilate isomerase
MTMIKICGLTSPEEAAFLNEIHSDFAGMVLFCGKSRRNIPIGRAKEIMEALDPAIRTVAVTVSPTVSQVRAVEEAGFDLIQIHGEAADDLIRDVRIPVIRAVNGTNYDSLDHMLELDPVVGILFDAGEPGSGKTFDWSALDGIDLKGRMKMLAGGLTPDNVAEAVRRVRPDVADVSTGVEQDSGRGKSREKIRRFAGEVRRACI